MLEKKEKILIYSFIAVAAIIILVVIINIWRINLTSGSTSDINTYTNITYEDTMESYYLEYLEEALKVTNFDELYEKIDDSYMEKVGITDKDELKEYLKDNRLISMTYEINDIELYTSDTSSNLFLVSYTVNNSEKYVNIIETSPYKYTISFIQSDELKELLNVNLNASKNDVQYDIEILESTKSSIRLGITITNNSNTTVTYDFSYLNSIQLKYGDSSYINMAAIANSSTVNYELVSQSSKTIEVLFNLNFENQFNITGLKFNNVKINGTSTSVEI